MRLTHTNLWESMGKPCSCMQYIKSHNFYYKSRKNLYQPCSCMQYIKSHNFYYKSRKNLYQVLQVTWKLYQYCENQFQCYKLLPLELLPLLHTHNNIDGNKIVIFSGIAFYSVILCGSFSWNLGYYFAYKK